MLNYVRAGVGVAALCLGTTAIAQVAPAPVAAPAVASARVLPAGTVVTLGATSTIDSTKIKVGDKFDFIVVSDVVEKGVVVIPRGSIASSTVTWKTGRGIGGKSGKFELGFDSLKANGQTFPLMGKHRQEGRGNTVGAVFGSIWISGKSAVMQQGQQVTAMIKEATTY